MADKPTYYDKRSDFWKRYWEQAKPYDHYLEGHDESLTVRWYETMERLPELQHEQAENYGDTTESLTCLCTLGSGAVTAPDRVPCSRR